jgi:hypothetical protein
VETCFMLAHAGIRRRKPVILIDLTGSGWLADPLAAACAAAAGPLRHFSAAGPGYYEPFRGGDPAQAASLVAGMIDWTGTPDQYRRTCTTYLTDAFAVLAAAPADPRLPVLMTWPLPRRAAGQAGPRACHRPRRAALADRGVRSARRRRTGCVVDRRRRARSCGRPRSASGWPRSPRCGPDSGDRRPCG